MVARVRRIMRSRVPCSIWMGIFFTWHSSEHAHHLDVKWSMAISVCIAGCLSKRISPAYAAATEDEKPFVHLRVARREAAPRFRAVILLFGYADSRSKYMV